MSRHSPGGSPRPPQDLKSPSHRNKPRVFRRLHGVSPGVDESGREIPIKKVHSKLRFAPQSLRRLSISGASLKQSWDDPCELRLQRELESISKLTDTNEECMEKQSARFAQIAEMTAVELRMSEESRCCLLHFIAWYEFLLVRRKGALGRTHKRVMLSLVTHRNSKRTRDIDVCTLCCEQIFLRWKLYTECIKNSDSKRLRTFKRHFKESALMDKNIGDNILLWSTGEDPIQSNESDDAWSFDKKSKEWDSLPEFAAASCASTAGPQSSDISPTKLRPSLSRHKAPNVSSPRARKAPNPPGRFWRPCGNPRNIRKDCEAWTKRTCTVGWRIKTMGGQTASRTPEVESPRSLKEWLHTMNAVMAIHQELERVRLMGRRHSVSRFPDCDVLQTEVAQLRQPYFGSRRKQPLDVAASWMSACQWEQQQPMRYGSCLEGSQPNNPHDKKSRTVHKLTYLDSRRLLNRP